MLRYRGPGIWGTTRAQVWGSLVPLNEVTKARKQGNSKVECHHPGADQKSHSHCYNYKARCRIRLLTVLNPAYTLPGGEPRIRDTIASRAILIFWNEPMMCIFLSRTEA